ncbi:MAG: hypothetical protein COY80_04670 [Candidatus Pacebacteria bacterium CG_4_10_14_0_8_um_filter_42_14]|nr:MAG: hypothetical protein COY80_04670 [Candidatus Pacebacteria bacterium CG_4_10_14_0_8_um_filter_42_14]
MRNYLQKKRKKEVNIRVFLILSPQEDLLKNSKAKQELVETLENIMRICQEKIIGSLERTKCHRSNDN